MINKSSNKKDYFEELYREIGWEFDKFILAHPDFAEKIPLGSQVIFLLEDNPEFNEWSKKINLAQLERGQPVVYLRIKKLREPQISRLVGPHIELATH